MSKESSSLNIKILDKDYRVSCPDEEQDSLRASADFLNRRLGEIRSRGVIIGSERIAIMAALNLAHELLHCQQYQQGYTDIDSRLGNLQNKIDIALREIEVS
jgi:cell division protein ZapA